MNWHNASWISCTRSLDNPCMAPREQMGSWISAPADMAVTGYQGEITLPDIPVVRAIAYWDSRPKSECTLVTNGNDEFLDKLIRNPRRYMDLAFELKEGANVIEIRFAEPRKALPVCFGVRIHLADGSVCELRSSESWQAIKADGTKASVTVLGDYGAEGFPSVVAFPRQRLAPAWFRRDFAVKKGLERATLHHTGVGYANAWLNGHAVSDRVLSPPQTDYETVTMFETDVVTELLKEGENALAIELASGWYHQVGGFGVTMSYGRPRLRACLVLEYEDGSQETVVSDEKWQWQEGAWREANVYAGEIVDFRRDHREWAVPGKGMGWEEAVTVDAPGKQLVPRDFEPMRRIREIAPRSLERVGKKTWLLDFGENIAGWIRMPVKERAGTEILIRYSEMARDGRMWNVPKSHWWCHGEPQRDLVITGGEPVVYESRFTYKGFRWVEVSGLSKAPNASEVRAVVVNTDVKTKARFTSSDPLLNRLWEMGLRTHYANMHSILEDCPHREKCQWGGDLHGSWAMGFHALDSARFYRQQARLFYTGAMAEEGIPGSIGVGKRLTQRPAAFCWGVSPLFITWRLWTHCGDLDTAREVHGTMRHFLAWFDEKSPDGFPYLHYHADHAAPDADIPRNPQDEELISAIHFFAAAERFGKLSAELDTTDDAAWASELAVSIREAVLTRYNWESHTFGNGTHDSLALAMGIFRGDGAAEVALAESLVGYYRKNGYQFDGGFMSYWIYPMLSRHGYVDDALRMLTNSDYPGPAWSVKQYDATTFWEMFSSNPAVQFERSLSHHAMNHPAAWLLTDLAGIRVDMDRPGGRHLLLAPCFPQDLDSVEAAMKTVTGGEVTSAWKKAEGSIEWTVTVPEGTRARLHVPGWEQQTGDELPAELQAGEHRFVLRHVGSSMGSTETGTR